MVQMLKEDFGEKLPPMNILKLGYIPGLLIRDPNIL